MQVWGKVAVAVGWGERHWIPLKHTNLPFPGYLPASGMSDCSQAWGKGAQHHHSSLREHVFSQLCMQTHIMHSLFAHGWRCVSISEHIWFGPECQISPNRKAQLVEVDGEPSIYVLIAWGPFPHANLTTGLGSIPGSANWGEIQTTRTWTLAQRASWTRRDLTNSVSLLLFLSLPDSRNEDEVVEASSSTAGSSASPSPPVPASVWLAKPSLFQLGQAPTK